MTVLRSLPISKGCIENKSFTSPSRSVRWGSGHQDRQEIPAAKAFHEKNTQLPTPCTSELRTVWLLLSSDKYWYLQVPEVLSMGEVLLTHQVNTLNCTWRQMSNLCRVEHL